MVNLLTAVNLTRVFRLVFLGPTQPKSRRAPEAPWQNGGTDGVSLHLHPAGTGHYG